MDICVGLTVNPLATNPEAMLAAADRIVFQVNDGDSNILCKTEKDGTETSTDSGIDIASGTAVTPPGFHVTNTSSVEFLVNRLLVATHTANIPDDENMTIGAMELGSATVTKSMSVDYLFASQTR